jgi:Pyruvate formate lyase-like
MVKGEKQAITENRRSRDAVGDRIAAILSAHQKVSDTSLNRLRCFSAGPDDILFSPYRWGGFPPVFSYLDTFADSLANCAEQIDLPDDFWREPLVIRRAIIFRDVLRKKLPISIEPWELIVGAPCPVALSKVLKSSERVRFNELEQQWRHQASKLIDFGIGSAALSTAHLSPDFGRVLTEGFSGIRAEIEAVRFNPKNREQADLAEAMVICIDGAVGFAHRYAEQAQRLAASESGDRKKELVQIAQICRTVPDLPAANLHQALQSVWFTRLYAMVAEAGPGQGISLGRLDQYLFPFYQADISTGRITRERAIELIRMLLIKIDVGGAYPLDDYLKNDVTSGMPCSITLGGTDEDGNDLTNDLTYVILDAVAALNLSQPDVALRLHPKSPARLRERAAEIAAAGGGCPLSFCYEEATFPLMAKVGVQQGQGSNYVAIGGPAWALPGKTISGAGDASINLLKILELAVNDGHDIETGKVLGPATGFADRFTDFAGLMEAFRRQLKNQANELGATRDLADLLRSVYEPVPLLSLLFDNCLSRGKDLYSGGADLQLGAINIIGFWSTVMALQGLKHSLFDGRGSKGRERKALGKKRGQPDTTDESNESSENETDALFEMASRLNRLLCDVLRGKDPISGKEIEVGYFDAIHHSYFSPVSHLRVTDSETDATLSTALNFPTEYRPITPEILAKRMSGIGLDRAVAGSEVILNLEYPTEDEIDEWQARLVVLLEEFGGAGITCLRLNVLGENLRKERNGEEVKVRAVGSRVSKKNLPLRIARDLRLHDPPQNSSFDQRVDGEATADFEPRVLFSERDFYPRGYLALTDSRGRPAVAPLYYIAQTDDATWVFADLFLGEIRRHLAPDRRVTLLVEQAGETQIFYGSLQSSTASGSSYDLLSDAEPFLSGSLAGLPGVWIFKIETSGNISRPSIVSGLVNRVAVDFASGFFGEGVNLFPDLLARLCSSFNTEVLLAYKDDSRQNQGVSLAFLPALAPATGSVAVYLQRFAEPPLKPFSALALAISGAGKISYQIKGSVLSAKTFLGVKIGRIEVERIYCSCPPLAGRRIR